MEQQKKKVQIVIISVVVLLVLGVAGALIYNKVFNKPETNDAEKTITVEIVFSEDNKKVVEITTEAEFLRGALEEKSLISGTESTYGLFITAVDGVVADDAKKQWWRVTKEGVDVNTGVDQVVIKDGDRFEITLSVY